MDEVPTQSPADEVQTTNLPLPARVECAPSHREGHSHQWNQHRPMPAQTGSKRTQSKVQREKLTTTQMKQNTSHFWRANSTIYTSTKSQMSDTSNNLSVEQKKRQTSSSHQTPPPGLARQG